jgi:uncharacterized protein DUF3306
MTAPDNFLSRWSRRKREAKTEAPLGPQPAPTRVAFEDAGSEAAEFVAQDEAAAEPSPDLPTSNLEILPSVESITENTDIRGFLRSGVPPELTRSALRRAWASDSSIRDFIGIAENQWDFNDPGAIAGFGPLSGINDAPALLKQALGQIDEAAEAVPDLLRPSRSAPATEIASRSDLLDGADVDARSPANQATAEIAGDSELAGADALSHPHRPHGSALPR